MRGQACHNPNAQRGNKFLKADLHNSIRNGPKGSVTKIILSEWAQALYFKLKHTHARTHTRTNTDGSSRFKGGQRKQSLLYFCFFRRASFGGITWIYIVGVKGKKHYQIESGYITTTLFLHKYTHVGRILSIDWILFWVSTTCPWAVALWAMQFTKVALRLTKLLLNSSETRDRYCV